MSDSRILVVEDEVDGQEVVSSILEMNGLLVDIVGDASSALQNLEVNTYDAAIIDIALPDMDGWGLLDAIRQQVHLAHMPCLAITAYHDSSVKQKSFQVGFDAYMPKPLNATTLVKTMENMLAS